MKNLLTIIADILLPKDPKVKFLEALGPVGLIEQLPPAEDFDLETEKVKALFGYKHPLCRQAIWEIKFRANKKLIRDFSLLLYDFILDEISDLNTFHNFKNIVLIPVPSSKTSRREKGFNQCVLLARELIKIDKERSAQNFSLFENLLVKKTDTSRQSKTKNRQERLENLRDTFLINQNNLNMTDYSFILIDDVITTGATMQESFRALQTAGAQKIIGIALAH